MRFWGEPPLVREPDVALFGFERLDPPEEQYLVASPLRRHPSLEVSTVGAAAAARLALERVHAAKHEFVLHFDVDVINSEEFPGQIFPALAASALNEVRDALRVFASQPNLAALVVAGYNPELDADGERRAKADRFAGGCAFDAVGRSVCGGRRRNRCESASVSRAARVFQKLRRRHTSRSQRFRRMSPIAAASAELSGPIGTGFDPS